jgi:glyoxylase-like metal-dependent hydrolase (beta-lactamase superfamily II)
MVEIIRHDGVTEWRFSSLASRLAGYTASAFLTADGVLIDTGIPAAGAEFDRLLDTATVRGVIVSHHHEDHAGNIERVARHGLPVWVSPLTLPSVIDVVPIGAYRRFTWRTMRPLVSPLTPFLPDAYTPIHAPGHSADHHVVWHAESRTLFGADLFLGVAVRIAHREEDPWVALESIDAAIALNPARLFCAHRGLVPDAVRALQAKAAWTRALIETISARMADGATDAQILKSEMGGESITGIASAGEYARINFVRAVRRRVDLKR